MTEQDPIRVTGKIEERDYVRAQWLHLRPRPVMAVVGVLFVTLLLAGGVLQTMSWIQGAKTAGDAMMLPFLTFLMLVYLALLNWRFHRSYRGYKAIQVPVDVEMSEEAFHGKSVHGETRLPWDMFQTFKESRHLLLLYQSAGLFHILPKRLFSHVGDVDRARDIFSRKVRSVT